MEDPDSVGMKKICFFCHKTFEKRKNISIKEWKGQKFCSRKCAYEYHREEKKCKNCGRLFKTPKSLKMIVFCGEKCRNEYKRNHPKEYNLFQVGHHGGTVIYLCEECGKETKQKRANYDKAIHHFCSIRCATIFQGRLKSGENHWNWKGGISERNHLIRNSTEYKEWRMKVFQRDHFACVKCGYRSKEGGDIRADHIKPFGLYPELRFEVSNGRTLCMPCDLKFGWNLFKENNPQIKIA